MGKLSLDTVRSHAIRMRLVVLAVALCAIAACDPFALDSTFDRLGRTLMAQVLSPFYGCTLRPAEIQVNCERALARNSITALVVTPKSAEQLGWPTPKLPYDAHSEYLEVLAFDELRPRAIFLDFVFGSRPLSGRGAAQIREQELQRLREAIRFLVEGGIPVFIGTVDESDPLGLANAGASLAPVKMEEPNGFYPLNHVHRGIDDAALSPAPAIYLELCQSGGNGTNPEWAAAICPDFGKSLAWIKSPEPLRMAVDWGFYPSPDRLYEKGALSDCPVEPDSNAQRFRDAIQNLWKRVTQGFSKGFRAPGRVVCEYTNWITPAQLFQAAGNPDGDAVQSLVRDKIVMVGLSNRFGVDEHISPVHGKTSGLMFHAMALDNLLTHGRAYSRPAFTLSGALDLADLAGISLALLAIILALWIRAKLESNEDLVKCLVYGALAPLLVTAVALLLVIWMSHRFSWPQSDWLALLVAVVTIFLLIGTGPFLGNFSETASIRWLKIPATFLAVLVSDYEPAPEPLPATRTPPRDDAQQHSTGIADNAGSMSDD